MRDTSVQGPVAGRAMRANYWPLSGDGAHWDHGTFTTEMMTPALYGSGNILSDMTLAALEDMGYETIYGDEEPATTTDDFLLG